MKPSNVVHRDEIAWTQAAQGKFRYRRKSFTAAAGMRRLGASLYEIEPGGVGLSAPLPLRERGGDLRAGGRRRAECRRSGS